MSARVVAAQIRARLASAPLAARRFDELSSDPESAPSSAKQLPNSGRADAGTRSLAHDVSRRFVFGLASRF